MMEPFSSPQLYRFWFSVKGKIRVKSKMTDWHIMDVTNPWQPNYFLIEPVG
jgi:hypothetical protein